MSTEGGLSFLEQLHALSEVACQTPNRPLMLGVSHLGGVVLTVQPPCKLWRCQPCAARNAKRWIARVIQGVNELDGDWHMFTLTAHENWRGQASVKNLRQGWKKLYNRMRRKFGTANYVRVWELHADGVSFHLHGLTDVHPTTRWLKDNARQCGMGYEVETHQVDNAGQVAGYIAKYTMKNEGFLKEYPDAWPKGLRRIEVSRSWVPWRELPENDIAWEMLPSVEYGEWRLNYFDRMNYLILDRANVRNRN